MRKEVLPQMKFILVSLLGGLIGLLLILWTGASTKGLLTYVLIYSFLTLINYFMKYRSKNKKA